MAWHAVLDELIRSQPSITQGKLPKTNLLLGSGGFFSAVDKPVFIHRPQLETKLKIQER